MDQHAYQFLCIAICDYILLKDHYMGILGNNKNRDQPNTFTHVQITTQRLLHHAVISVVITMQ